MTVKERIHAEIDSLDSSELDELYEVIKLYARSPKSFAEAIARMIAAHEEQGKVLTELLDRLNMRLKESNKPGTQAAAPSQPPHGANLVEKLKSISLDGPEDFAINHDRYVLGQDVE